MPLEALRVPIPSLWGRRRKTSHFLRVREEKKVVCVICTLSKYETPSSNIKGDRSAESKYANTGRSVNLETEVFSSLAAKPYFFKQPCI